MLNPRKHSNGYLTVYMPDHPDAWKTGYVYHHRLVAEEKIGRRLLPSEQVHHIDGNKTNNSPQNLLVCSTCLEHSIHHRIDPTVLRAPGELNPIIDCACGCGGTLERYDYQGRPRKFIDYHQSRVIVGPLQAQVAKVLQGKNLTVTEIAQSLNKTNKSIRDVLSLMKEQHGSVRRVRRAVWELIP